MLWAGLKLHKWLCLVAFNSSQVWSAALSCCGRWVSHDQRCHTALAFIEAGQAAALSCCLRDHPHDCQHLAVGGELQF